MRELLMRLSCLIGNCHYSDANLKSRYLRHQDGFDVYEMVNRCLYCGKEYHIEIGLWNPKEEEKK